MIKENRKFIIISLVLLVFTFSFAYYVANILFYGKNSYEVYANLKNRKAKLQTDIKRLQYENALLQKKYFELKNLEPEKL
jgi:cell division protein FtsB